MKPISKIPNARFRLEALEDRCTPTSYVSLAGDLVIVGGAGNDNVSVTQETRGGLTYYRVTENGSSRLFLSARVFSGRVLFYGNAGNDRFDNMTSLRTFALGGAGSDLLAGGSRDDRIAGGDGNDLIFARAGNDIVFGGTGSDMLWGMNGNDDLNGGDDGSSDLLNGGPGRDRFQQEGSRDFASDFNPAEDQRYG